ncbi:carbamoyl phosphate synthase small subunit [Aquibacillus sp. 3ASR75-11]|uniref:Carbamoyl phosphate synthase small chain n=1 Tax=Terrihalobacillus insolitus TaxID=2950438 RepID=A0A9X4AMS3_9BACI|nr:carbamoyl phosphate synthase small subunit [Terrihalobacillus insolitus]MDC3425109.1 carbamoyl phosphate synthase small subunit [Terrihalobacillus insolitus]
MVLEKGYLVLSTGDALEGKWLGASSSVEGEMVFNTAMTGYQEVMTDPSYAGQIVTMTYPLIGNYGINDIDFESGEPALSGLIISSPCYKPDHYQANSSIREIVDKFHIPTLYDIDTRALTRIIRENGEVYGKFSMSKEDKPKKAKVDAKIVDQVSVKKMIRLRTSSNQSHLTEFSKAHVVLVDFGYKHSIRHALMELGCDVTIVPYNTSVEVIKGLEPDGIVLSNGPGDPKDLDYLKHSIKKLTELYPTLGICLGHQLVAIAHGGETTRLPYGHRGSNHPVKDLTTGKVWITTQNHGYVVDMDSIDEQEWQISHINVNDRSVEGLMHREKPILTVQFHPEAHPGPIDTHLIFQDFFNRLVRKGEKQHA